MQTFSEIGHVAAELQRAEFELAAVRRISLFCVPKSCTFLEWSPSNRDWCRTLQPNKNVELVLMKRAKMARDFAVFGPLQNLSEWNQKFAASSNRMT